MFLLRLFLEVSAWISYLKIIDLTVLLIQVLNMLYRNLEWGLEPDLFLHTS